jgi:hypothetical protein
LSQNGGRHPAASGQVEVIEDGVEAISRSTTVLAGLADIRGWQEEFYRDLHQHPELSHQEHRTAARVAERLRAIGFSVHEGIGGTGLSGCWGTGTARPCCCAPTWTAWYVDVRCGTRGCSPRRCWKRVRR